MEESRANLSHGILSLREAGVARCQCLLTDSGAGCVLEKFTSSTLCALSLASCCRLAAIAAIGVPHRLGSRRDYRILSVPMPIQLLLGEERAVVELKARWLLGDVDVDRCPREHGGYRERKLPARFAFSLDPIERGSLFRRDRSEGLEKQRAVDLAIARTDLCRDDVYCCSNAKEPSRGRSRPGSHSASTRMTTTLKPAGNMPRTGYRSPNYSFSALDRMARCLF